MNEIKEDGSVLHLQHIGIPDEEAPVSAQSLLQRMFRMLRLYLGSRDKTGDQDRDIKRRLEERGDQGEF